MFNFAFLFSPNLNLSGDSPPPKGSSSATFVSVVSSNYFVSVSGFSLLGFLILSPIFCLDHCLSQTLSYVTNFFSWEFDLSYFGC
jgi:hypothetical protein